MPRRLAYTDPCQRQVALAKTLQAENKDDVDYVAGPCRVDRINACMFVVEVIPQMPKLHTLYVSRNCITRLHLQCNVGNVTELAAGDACSSSLLLLLLSVFPGKASHVARFLSWIDFTSTTLVHYSCRDSCSFPSLL